MSHSRNPLAIAAFVVVCIVWGTTYLAIRIAVETVPPMLLTSCRYVVAGLIMTGIALARGSKIPRDWRTLRDLLVVGILMVSVGNLAVVWAEQWLSSGIAALLVATSPFWSAVIELFRRDGDRLDLRRAIGMIIGFGGVAMLVVPGGSNGQSTHFIAGALVIQLGAFGWQYGTIRSKYHLRHVPLMLSAALQALFGGLATGLVGLAAGEASHFHLTTRTFLALAYLTLFGSVLAYSAYVYAIAHLRTSTSSLYAYVNPLVAVLLGWLILHETLGLTSIIAMVVILGGVALVQTAPARPSVPADSMPEAEQHAA